MQPIKVNEKSWHYWIVSNLSDPEQGVNNLDICTYTFLLLRGLFILFMAVCASGFFIVPVVCWIGQFIIPTFFKQFPHLIDMGLLWLIFLLLGTILGLFFAGLNWLGSHRKKSDQPNIFVHMYRSWKGKYCVPVVITKSGDQ